MKSFLSFEEIIERATEEKPRGEIEWFEQVLAALKNGQVEDAIVAIEKAIKWKKEQRR